MIKHLTTFTGFPVCIFFAKNTQVGVFVQTLGHGEIGQLICGLENTAARQGSGAR
jgi:hypothetical protein